MHRAGRREPGEVRQRGQRPGQPGGALRHGRGDGLQEAEGRRREGQEQIPARRRGGLQGGAQRGRRQHQPSLFAEGFNLFGTTGGVDLSSAICDTPVKNWREAQWKEGMESLSGVRIADTILTDRRSCYACPIACKRVVEIKDGEYAMPEGPGPSTRAWAPWASFLAIDDMHAVVKANALCNAYGMDAISTGGTIAYAIEAFQNGLDQRERHRRHRPGLGPAGPADRAGRTRSPAARVSATSWRRGAALCPRSTAARSSPSRSRGWSAPCTTPAPCGPWPWATPPASAAPATTGTPTWGWRWAWTTSRRSGFARTRPQRREGKAMQTIHSQAIASVCDSAVICIFAWKGMGSTVAILRDMINAVTGYRPRPWTSCWRSGNRIWYLKRAIGNLCGVDRGGRPGPARIIEPHLEGTATDLLRVLNPVLRVNNRLMGMIKNEKLSST